MNLLFLINSILIFPFQYPQFFTDPPPPRIFFRYGPSGSTPALRLHQSDEKLMNAFDLVN